MNIESLKRLIGTPRDSALLRVTIANALLQDERQNEAEQQLVAATELDPDYTAAWKQLGKVRLSLEDKEGARQAWQSGIEIAEKNGDKQAGKEMNVFLRRLDR